MRKIALMLFLVILSQAAMAEWITHGTSGGGDNVIYFDSATIRKNGDKVKMWSLYDFKTAKPFTSGKFSFSQMMQYEYDCKHEQIRLLALSLHSGNMRAGDVLYSEYDSGKWEPVSPGSIHEAMWQIACGTR